MIYKFNLIKYYHTQKPSSCFLNLDFSRETLNEYFIIEVIKP